MKILYIIKNIVCIILLSLLLLTALTGYFKWAPPMSVTLVPFRMILQITLKYQILLMGLITCGFFVYRVLKHTFIFHFNINLILATFCCLIFILDLSTLLRINCCNSLQNDITCTGAVPGSDRPSYSLRMTKDYSSDTGMEQGKLYQDAQSEYKSICIIYLNYGGWSMQEESYGSQVYSFCEKEGYSFLRLATPREENEPILSVVQKIDNSINTILQKEAFEKVFLCGGSAGGHLSLLCAYKETGDENFPVPGITVDGVIALYPCVDPSASYHYYVDNDSARQGLLGKLGDKIYCSLYPGKATTFAQSTKYLNEGIFGSIDAADNTYETVTIKNCIGQKKIPVLIAQGQLDSMIYVKSVHDFYNTLCENQIPSVYLELPSTEHVFDLFPTTSWSRSEKEMTGFVRTVVER